MDGMEGVLVPLESSPIGTSGKGAQPAPVKNAPMKAAPVKTSGPVKTNEAPAVRQVTSDGTVSVSVRQESPLKATLHATRKRGRDVVYAA